MVIDKTNPNLISPLLGNKNKETFYQLKAEYENLLQISNQLNNKISRKKHKEDSIDIDYIKNNVNKIIVSLTAIDEILNEYFNFYENNKVSNQQETKDIINKIIAEQRIIIYNIKKSNININYDQLIENFNKILNYESEINTITTESDKSSDTLNNIIEVNEETNNNITNNDSRRRTVIPKYFNNARIIRNNNLEYSLEEPSLFNNSGKVLLISLIVLLNLYLFSKLF